MTGIGALHAQQVPGRKVLSPVSADPLELYNPSPALIKARAAASKAALVTVPAKTAAGPIAARGNNACNLLINGDFNNQSARPSQMQNVSTPVPGSVSQLPNWFAPNYSTPDFFATNAASADLTPTGSSRGGFTPLNGSNASTQDGAVGIVFSRLIGGAQGYPEYIAQQLPTSLVAGAKYYAEFYALHASAFTQARALQLYVAQNSPSASPPVNATDYGTAPNRLPYSGRGFVSPALTNPSQWQRVSGIFTGQGTDNFLCIGYSDPDNYTTPFTGSQQASYYYIDDVALYKIPTAGTDATSNCGTPTTIGEGCAIPYASYAWSIGGGAPFMTSQTSPQVTVAPSTTTIYTLTVTLPDGTTSASQVTVTASGTPNLELQEHSQQVQCFENNEWFRVLNFNSSLTYTINRSGAGAVQTNLRTADFRLKWTAGESGATFTVTVTSASCGAVTFGPYYANNDGCTGASAASSSAGRTAYPNPAAETLTMPESADSPTLLNSRGEPVKATFKVGKLDVQNLPDGLYNLRFKQNGKTVNQRIQVKH